jgi:hypothetical protein
MAFLAHVLAHAARCHRKPLSAAGRGIYVGWLTARLEPARAMGRVCAVQITAVTSGGQPQLWPRLPQASCLPPQGGACGAAGPAPAARALRLGAPARPARRATCRQCP